ncbi:MAG: type II secretion system GspH family protein [Clostridiales bacterium]|jgi:prepilin-type N-terminal cleavage/methylation domain-containing protein|nr:type II secretion system GspH family protein [Clostridiales bacterium]
MLKWVIEIKNRKGMTLVEVIVSMCILSFLSVVLVQGIANQYAFMHNTKSMTENSYLAAKQVEEETQRIKDIISGKNSDPLPTPATYTMFNYWGGTPRTISYYPVMKYINDKNGNPTSKAIYSVVTDIRPPEFETPSLTNFMAILKTSGTAVDGAYATTPSTVIDLKYDVVKPHLLLMVKYQWYMSDASFPMTWKNVGIDDPGVGIEVPSFPDDFSIIPYAVSKQLTVDSSMAGRHLVCVMTPASREGKMGVAVMTKPIYIYGLPVLNNLKAHYDASLIELPSGITAAGILNDISRKGVNAIHYGYTPSNLIVTDFPQLENRTYPIKAKAVDLSLGGWFEATGLALGASSNFTMFAVAKTNDPTWGSIISNNSAWAFDMFSFPGATDGDWHILGINSNSKRTIGKNASLSAGGLIGDRMFGGSIIIGGGSEIELAELIIYNSLLSDADWLKVTRYLGEKYNLN